MVEDIMLLLALRMLSTILRVNLHCTSVLFQSYYYNNTYTPTNQTNTTHLCKLGEIVSAAELTHKHSCFIIPPRLRTVHLLGFRLDVKET